MIEIELKLELTEAAAQELAASPTLAGEPAVHQLRATYFDTPDHALAKGGISLRIRASGDARFQTIKADGEAGAGLFHRSEWEMPVDGDTPVLDDTMPIKALLGDRTDEITPQFNVEVERKVWIVPEGDAEIEVVIDRGEIIAGDRREAISEVELELKRGHSSALFALARKLDEVAPLRLGVLTKAERGYRLTKPARSAFKAETLMLAGELSAGEAFQRVVQACLRQFRLNESILLETRSDQALHQARVALRRLRSAFSIFKPVLR